MWVRMLQPWSTSGFIFKLIVVFLVSINCITGQQINTSPRERRQNGEDVTTVLLVDSQGRSTFGRFLSVKPDLGLLTSTARTFIQEGVTTEYATQVLGTTLDNGRLYAHLLTKSSRVRYDSDAPTKSLNNIHPTKKWNLNNGNGGATRNFVKNTDYIAPNQVEPFIVFPTTKPKSYKFYTEEENEELKPAPSNNPRQPYDANREAKFIAFTTKNKQNGIKAFQNNPQYKNLHIQNAISYKESSENDIPKTDDLLNPSKVREWNNLPTFTVRNEFSPSGYSYLGDFPEFEINTEKTKSTTISERKAKLLFRPHVPENHELKTVTYTGFADFTTTVGDTVIIFSPSTAGIEKEQTGHVTKIKVEPTLQTTFTPTPTVATENYIKPTAAVIDRVLPTVTTEITTTTTDREEVETEKEEIIKADEDEDEDEDDDEDEDASQAKEEDKDDDESEKEDKDEDESRKEDEEKDEDVTKDEEEEHTTKLFSMILDTSDRPLKQSEEASEPVDHDAKLSVLANEQKYYLPTPQIDETVIESTESDVVMPSSEVIQPSETQTPSLLSTPSFEDIAKILASLQAQEMNKGASSSESSSLDEESISSVATEPLNTKSTIFLEEEPIENTQSEDSISVLTGAKTIFFDDLFPTALDEPMLSSVSEEVTTTQATTTPELKEVTTENLKETTEAIINTVKESVTFNEIPREDEFSTISIQETTPEIKNEIETEEYENAQKDEEEPETDIVCTTGEKIIATTSYQTYNVLTTFYIPDGDITTTSIKSGRSISTEIGFQTILCDPSVEPTPVTEVLQSVTDATAQNDEVTELYTKLKLEPTTEQITTVDNSQGTTPILTTPVEITTERHEVTESDAELSETTTESGEEIELVVKTLYTTFNYLTTYFFNNTSSIATSKTIATNVVTSTIYPGQEESIEPSSVVLNDLKTKISFADLDLSDMDSEDAAQEDEQRDDEEESDNNVRPTPSLDIALTSLAFKLKTYFTTYTYFSTIYDGEDDSRVLSRTEVKSSVYTDYIDATPTVEIEPSSILEDLLTAVKEETDNEGEINEDSFVNLHKYNTTISRPKVAKSEEQTDIYDTATDNIDNNILPTFKSKSYSTLVRNPILESSENTFDLSDYEIISNMVTNVRSSTSKGDTKVLENVDKRNVLDDQVFSESNNESEIIPSPTLLLQTSYTTFTYFTTTYHGTTSSDVASSLKTVTNVVTETLTPQTLKPGDFDVPITYFTTFTYWTTSVKKNTTIVKSSEKTITNVETATPVITEKPTISILPTQALDVQPTPVIETLYSTFTYYTTSYFNDNSSTVYSSLATSSRVITNTPELVGETKTIDLGPTTVAETVKSNETERTGLISTIVETVENAGTKTVLSTDVFGTYINGKYAQVQERTFSILTDAIEPTKAPEIVLKPTGVLSINKGRIVDAEGVSTLFYTTQAIGTYIDDSYAQVIDSTSSISVDDEKKKLLPTDLPIHRTGLVRIIEGAIIQNDTTTLYHSNVFGTLIGTNYAQVIESTSSFIVGKKASIVPTSVQEIALGPTKAPGNQIESKVPITPSPVVIEGSLTESTRLDEENTTENEEEDEELRNTKTKGRPGQKKNQYTQVIRPFTPQRNGRPSFFPQPRRKSASTVTRSDVVPTVTAIPAKPRFSGGRKSSSFNNNVISPTSSRRFARPKSSVTSITSATGYGGGRRSSSRIQPTSGIYASSSKRPGFRSSANSKSAAIYNLKQRIRPTAAIGFNRFASTVTPPSANDEENELTTYTENPTAYTDDEAAQTLPSTTESSARNRNPLLRFRPGLSRPSTTPRSARPSKNSKNFKTTTTTAKPRSFSRPIASLQNRPRPPNALFPRRGLFTTTTTAAPEEEEEEEEEEEIDDLDHEDADLDESDYDASDVEIQTQSPSARIGRSFSPAPVQIRPFIRRRSRRQVHYSRFRRPGARTTAAPKEEPTTEAAPPTRPKSNRFSSKNTRRPGYTKSEPKTTTPSPKRISPTKASTHGRSQFTLRDTSSNRSSFKRPSSPSRKNSNSNSNSTPSRPTAPKLKNSQFSESRTVRPRTSNAEKPRSRRPVSRRPAQTTPDMENFVLPSFDGTITVTYQIPTEATIPIVNGKITEYKNIITAKYSTQVLAPNQYTTSLNQYGKDVTVLVDESTGIGGNGATQITQFILNETPTTSVIFTPTYIRGRKTSYSHVIPSTVYAVEEVISTIQPALAQAPLANILLSQLLLGNVGFQQPNPLLGFQNPAVPGTPTTEFKTRTTTYVTTVTKATSTVIPLTFRGKEILTTIIDSSTQVITATEFLTDTVVVTPTAALPQFANGNQLNSLLVPLLLQQQQQQQQPSNPLIQQPAGVFSLEQQLTAAPQLQNDKYNNIDDDKIGENDLAKEEEPATTQTPKLRKGTRKRNKKPTPAPTPPPKETSIVTLYVSGRQPGEFTTVLSTYVVGEEQRRKRDVQYIPVQASKAIEIASTRSPTSFHSYVMPTGKELRYIEDTFLPTESLESVLGDVNKYITTSTFSYLDTKPTKVSNQPSKKYYSKKVKATLLTKQKTDTGSFLVQ